MYKNKGNAQNYINYIAIKLIRHIIKLWKRMIKIKRLRKETKNKFRFMFERLIEKIYFLKQLNLILCLKGR